MALRKRMTGAGSSWLIKLIAIAVFIMIGLPYLKGCMEQAPQKAADIVSDAVDSATTAAKNAATDAVNQAIDGAKGANPAPQKSKCMAQDDAARLALQEARLRTKTCGDVEFGGSVFSYVDGARTCYDYTDPSGGEGFHTQILWDKNATSIKGHSNPKPVASYHSHPSGGLAEFSVADICGYIASDPHVGYVVATNLVNDGKMKRFDGNGNRFSGVTGWLAKGAFASDITSGYSFGANLEYSDDMFTRTAGVGTVTVLSTLPSIPAGAACPAKQPTAGSSDPTITLDASAVLIDPGANVTVAWTASQATGCNIGFVGNDGKDLIPPKSVPSSGGLNLTHLKSTVLVTLTCDRNGSHPTQSRLIQLKDDAVKQFAQCS